jgi:hypothetical protein
MRFIACLVAHQPREAIFQRQATTGRLRGIVFRQAG